MRLRRRNGDPDLEDPPLVFSGPSCLSVAQRFERGTYVRRVSYIVRNWNGEFKKSECLEMS